MARSIHYASCEVGKVFFPLNKSTPLIRTIFSKSRSENLEMTEHSIVTPGNLHFYSNHNNLIRVWWIDCYCPFFWLFCKFVGDWQILIRVYNQIELAYIAFKYISINNIDS